MNISQYPQQIQLSFDRISQGIRKISVTIRQNLSRGNSNRMAEFNPAICLNQHFDILLHCACSQCRRERHKQLQHSNYLVQRTIANDMI